MNFKKGDIVIERKGSGHTLICVQDGNDSTNSNAKFIHATKKGIKEVPFEYYVKAQKRIFRKDREATTKFLFESEKVDIFRFVDLSERDSTNLIEIARRIQLKSDYGSIFRVIRVWVGSKKLGNKAEKRLEKYISNFKKDEKRIVRKVTCSELVVLSYQLMAIDNNLGPKLFDLDASHVMPSTLKKYFDEHNNFKKVTSGGESYGQADAGRDHLGAGEADTNPAPGSSDASAGSGNGDPPSAPGSSDASAGSGNGDPPSAPGSSDASAGSDVSEARPDLGIGMLGPGEGGPDFPSEKEPGFK